jgi:hypothetical protein
MRELTGDQRPKSFLLQHKKTSLNERPIAMRLSPLRLSSVADGIPPDCNQSDVYVKMVITKLCYFFNKISRKVIDEDELRDLQEFIGETMMQLEI